MPGCTSSKGPPGDTAASTTSLSQAPQQDLLASDEAGTTVENAAGFACELIDLDGVGTTAGNDHATDPQTDPEGPTNVAERVIRGGSWSHLADRQLSWDSYYSPPPPDAFGGMGFRVLRIAP